MTLRAAPRAVILGCAGPVLDADERRFMAEADPTGFILFKRNCETPEQVRALVSALREAIARPDAPVLIDQEGGRVARLGAPHWRVPPAPALFGALAKIDETAGARAAWLNARLVAADLHSLGITVNCAPVLDLHVGHAGNAIGDRSLGADPHVVGRLGRAVCDGLAAGGIVPAIKHLPGTRTRDRRQPRGAAACRGIARRAARFRFRAFSRASRHAGGTDGPCVL